MSAIETLLKYQDSFNVASFLDDDRLVEIGHLVMDEFRVDEQSRSEWKRVLDDSAKNLKQVNESKSFPWDGASNVKYPLTSFACVSFASQVYRELIKNGKIVEVQVIGEDPDGMKERRAKRIGGHMNYQLLSESDSWEPDIDQLLHVLAFAGFVVHKGFYDPLMKRPMFELCKPESIVVHQNIKSLNTARRVSHVVNVYKNDIIEKIRAGMYLDVDVDRLDGKVDDFTKDPVHELVEQHRFLDLDGDGYQEPYIVIVHKVSEKVLGIYARYDLIDPNGVVLNEDGEIVRITPINYFIDYHLIKDPEGGFYSLGFGHLLYHMNETINTLINQLIDSGTLANVQGGFVGRGFKIKGGSLKFKMGEFKVLDFGTTQDISQNIMPLPFKEPSAVLFQTLGLMMQTGKELALINDVMTGDISTQNSAATTVLAMLERGMKVYSAILKRIHRSLKKEFQLLYYLNKRYLDETTYFKTLDTLEAVARLDYEDESLDVIPVADPTVASDVLRYTKAQALLQLIPLPMVNGHEIIRRYLEDLEIRQIDAILPPPQPAPPSPDMIEAQAKIMKMQMEAESDKMDKELKLMELKLKEKELNIMANESGAKIAKLESDAVAAVHNARLNRDKAVLQRDKIILDKDSKNTELRIKDKEIITKAKEKKKDDKQR